MVVISRCTEGKNEHECSWCVFMKSGPCFKPFEIWQKCILAVGEDDDDDDDDDLESGRLGVIH